MLHLLGVFVTSGALNLYLAHVSYLRIIQLCAKQTSESEQHMQYTKTIEWLVVDKAHRAKSSVSMLHSPGIFVTSGTLIYIHHLSAVIGIYSYVQNKHLKANNTFNTQKQLNSLLLTKHTVPKALCPCFIRLASLLRQAH